MQGLRPHPRPPEPETLGAEPTVRVLRSPAADADAHPSLLTVALASRFQSLSTIHLEHL